MGANIFRIENVPRFRYQKSDITIEFCDIKLVEIACSMFQIWSFSLIFSVLKILNMGVFGKNLRLTEKSNRISAFTEWKFKSRSCMPQKIGCRRSVIILENSRVIIWRESGCENSETISFKMIQIIYYWIKIHTKLSWTILWFLNFHSLILVKWQL